MSSKVYQMKDRRVQHTVKPSHIVVREFTHYAWITVAVVAAAAFCILLYIACEQAKELEAWRCFKTVKQYGEG